MFLTGLYGWLRNRFFNQYPFHKQKLVLHRATMQMFAGHLRERHITVNYIEAVDPLSDIRKLIIHLAGEGVTEIHYADVVDEWLEKRMVSSCKKSGIGLIKYNTPNFLNTLQDVKVFFEKRKPICRQTFISGKESNGNCY